MSPKKKTTTKKTVRKAAVKKKTATKKGSQKTVKKAPVKKATMKKSTPKKAAAKKAVKKAAAKKAPIKKAATKKPTTKKTVAKKAVKKAVTKKATAKKTTTKKTVAKKALTKKAATKKSTAKKTTTKAATKKAAAKKTATKKAAVKKAPQKKTPAPIDPSKTPSSILKTNVPDKKRVFDEKRITPIVFSLDDVNSLLAERKTKTVKPEEKSLSKPAPKQAKKKPKSRIITDAEKTPAKKRVLGAASLADILGFDPSKKKSATLDGEDIPQKWKKYYKLLLDLRKHVQDELDLHTADTLKHSSNEDSGDLAHYGNHQADAGTDSFDRDFALSLVSTEQDALNEIEEAIQRMRDGSYGVCEVTGKAIKKERLLAVPFARFSVEGQKEHEKNSRRKLNRDPGNLFGDSDETLKLSNNEEGDE
ncbi:MAG: TraR/DksA family transcriptional regulator [Coraliomargaritaceae bacterium]